MCMKAGMDADVSTGQGTGIEHSQPLPVQEQQYLRHYVNQITLCKCTVDRESQDFSAVFAYCPLVYCVTQTPAMPTLFSWG